MMDYTFLRFLDHPPCAWCEGPLAEGVSEARPPREWKGSWFHAECLWKALRDAPFREWMKTRAGRHAGQPGKGADDGLAKVA